LVLTPDEGSDLILSVVNKLLTMACCLLLAASALGQSDACTDLDGRPEACPKQERQATGNKRRAEEVTGNPKLETGNSIVGGSQAAGNWKPETGNSVSCTDLDGHPEACPKQERQATGDKRRAEEVTGNPKLETGNGSVGSPDTGNGKPETGNSVSCTDLDGHPEACPGRQEQQVASDKQQVEEQQATGNKRRAEEVTGNPKLETGNSIAGGPPATGNRKLETVNSVFSDFVGDQKWFWTSPFRIREKDLPWLLPFAVGAATIVASDTAIEKHLPTSKTTIDRSKTFSDAGVAALAAGSVGAYVWGRFRSEDHLRETGLLSAEAAADSLVASEVIKFTTGRDRPLQGNRRGNWFQGGDSFPSEHSAAAWSMATVVAGQYPGWMTKLLAYGGAAAVSAARVTSREHFVSDALIGSTLGWYIGHHVLNRENSASCPLFRACPERSRSIARYGTFDKQEQQVTSNKQQVEQPGHRFTQIDADNEEQQITGSKQQVETATGNPSAALRAGSEPETSNASSSTGQQPEHVPSVAEGTEDRELPYCTDTDGHPEPCPQQEQQATSNKQQVAQPAPSTSSGRALSAVEGSTPALAARETGDGKRKTAFESREPRAVKNMGSPYVPLESWVYPAFDRLIALGYAQSAIVSLRPWTRLECARLLEEAEGNLQFAISNLQKEKKQQPTSELYKSKITNYKSDTEAARLYNALNHEFAHERALFENGGKNRSAQVESIYTRFTGISGQPLTDGMHFGQTLFNDYGRPYQEGFNNVTGVSSYATAGPLAIYVRGEYQNAPSGPALSPSARAAVANADGPPTVPVADVPGGPVNATNRFRLLDSYVALNVSNWQLSFGKQSLWWGPTFGGSLQLSNNAEPVRMLRLARVSPFKLPSILGLLGPIRNESFLGQLQGHDFIRLAWPNFPLVGTLGVPINPQPYIWGEKVNFHPTPNLEFGVSAVAIFAGYGRPLTLGTFLHTFNTSGDAQAVDPGKRTGGFDFSYRIPGLRNWLTLYTSSITWDEINPIAYPRRSAMNPGIYMPKLPKLSKLDLRVEGVYTDLPNLRTVGTYYTNTHYFDGYTNYGQIMGSWIGPQGRGVQAWSTYWFSPQRTLQAYYRYERVDPVYVGGGHIYDIGTQANFNIHRFMITPIIQFERWTFPVLASGQQLNVTTSVQLTYRMH
jgi:membrane-associated phospholipid phosphatase